MLVDTQTILTVKPYNNPHTAVELCPVNSASPITAIKCENPVSPNNLPGFPLFSELYVDPESSFQALLNNTECQKAPSINENTVKTATASQLISENDVHKFIENTKLKMIY